MQIEYRISESDYVNAAKLAAAATRKQFIWLFLLGLLLLALALFGSGILRSVGIFGMVGGAIGYLVTLMVVSPWSARQHYRKYKLIQDDLSIEVTGSGYALKAAGGESRVQWPDLLLWRENKDYILLYFAPRMYHLIPKRLSEQGLDLHQLRLDLQSNLGPAA